MRVFVNGYGSIGSRIAAFLQDDPEIKLVGVGKHSPDGGVSAAKSRGLDVYAPKSKLELFDGVSGSIESALDASDLVIDASPGGSGYANKKKLYEPRNIRAIYQGGESASGGESVSEILFNSRVNYDSAINQKHVMQGSCNVTGMGRVIEPLRNAFGKSIVRFDVTLVRRWADMEQAGKTVTDSIEMTQSPHHGDDAKKYLGEAPLFVRAIKVPSRQMHLHIMDVRFACGAPKPSEIHSLFASERGVATLWTARGTRDVRKFADSLGFAFSDTNMIHIHANMTSSIGDTASIWYSDDQTGIVIPENHMLMQAMLFGRPYEDAASHTESVFHMAEKKEMLESHFKASQS